MNRDEGSGKWKREEDVGLAAVNGEEGNGERE